MKKLLIILLVLILSLSSQAQIIMRTYPVYVASATGGGGAIDLITGLVSGWQFEESVGVANDTISVNDGTVTNATTQVAGKIGYCYSFAGTGKVDMGEVPALELTDLSVAFWMKTSTSDFLGVVTNYNDVETDGYHFTTELENIKFEIRNSVSGVASVQSDADIVDGAWHHIVGTFDGANIRLYINGVEDVNSPTAFAFDPTYVESTPFQIGARNSTLNYTGSIDQVWVWSKVLTSTEVTELYTKENAGTSYPW